MMSIKKGVLLVALPLLLTGCCCGTSSLDCCDWPQTDYCPSVSCYNDCRIRPSRVVKCKTVCCETRTSCNDCGSCGNARSTGKTDYVYK